MPEITFEQFRLSLRRREQLSIFEAIEEYSREQWITRLFKTEVEFVHFGSEYHYLPKTSDDRSDVLVGRLGRKSYATRNMPPDAGLEEYVDETWRASVILVDPTEHADGQKIAMQRLRDVGKPISLLPRLIQALEAKLEPDIRFLTGVHPITNEQAFWEFIRKNEGKVTKISFLMEVPNMFGSVDEFEKEMEKFRDEDNAQKVKIEIENPDGLDTSSQRIAYTAEKTMERGTGKVTAKAFGKNNTFSSQKQQKNVKIQLDDDTENTPLVERASGFAHRIFGRDED